LLAVTNWISRIFNCSAVDRVGEKHLNNKYLEYITDFEKWCRQLPDLGLYVRGWRDEQSPKPESLCPSSVYAFFGRRLVPGIRIDLFEMITQVSPGKEPVRKRRRP
jgi:hypothetical protein